MIFEADSRNSDQECLDVISVSSDVTPLVLGAVKDSESTFDVSVQPSVRGRLLKCIDFWRTLPASQFILNVISQGYKIPFFQLPTPFYKVNNASARSNSSFVTIAVNELLSLNLIEEIFCAPDIINPLSVSTQRSGKQRLILDLRHVNTFIYKQKFKCEDLSVATQVFDKGFYLFKFDLKSGYHHIEVFPITGDSLRSPGILALGFLGISNFACFRLGSRQPPLFSLKFSNRFRNLGEARASLLSFFSTMF